MFTSRQLLLLSNLLANQEGLTGPELAEQLQVSVKTVYSEIQTINHLLPRAEAISFVPGVGYSIAQLQPETIQRIAQEIDDAKVRSDETRRSTLIISVLAFQQDYVSMGKLADMLHLSKSAVSKEFEASWLLQQHVEISPIHGLRITYDEELKRNLLSKFFGRDREILSLLGLEEEFSTLTNQIRSPLYEAFIQQDYSVSGEALKSFRTYLVICIIRSRRGFTVDQAQPTELSPLMVAIATLILEKTGYRLTAFELANAQRRLNSLNVLTSNSEQVRQPAVLAELKASYERFLAVVQSTFQLDFSLAPPLLDKFLMHMYKLKYRLLAGFDNANFLKRTINRKYPLTAHVVSHCLPGCFDLEIPDTELAFIIPYFAGHEVKRPAIRALLVGDHHPALLHQTAQQLEATMPSLVSSVQIVSTYLYLGEPERWQGYPLVFTTDSEPLIVRPDALPIEPVLQSSDLANIAERARAVLASRAEAELGRLVEAYVRFLPLTSSARSLPELVRSLGIAAQGYELRLDSSVAFYPSLCEAGEASEIRVYLLSPPLRYRAHEVEAVIFSKYQPAEQNASAFYAVIRRLLEPGRLNGYLTE